MILDLINMGLTEPIFTYVVYCAKTKKIAGLRLTGTLEKSHKQEDFPTYNNYAADAISKFLSTLESKVRFTQYPYITTIRKIIELI